MYNVYIFHRRHLLNGRDPRRYDMHAPLCVARTTQQIAIIFTAVFIYFHRHVCNEKPISGQDPDLYNKNVYFRYVRRVHVFYFATNRNAHFFSVYFRKSTKFLVFSGAFSDRILFFLNQMFLF